MNPFRIVGHRWALLSVALIVIGSLATLLGLKPDLRQSLLASTAKAASAQPATRVLPVKTIRLGELTAPVRMDAYRGTIEASKSSNLSFRRSGRLLRIDVREGDSVAENQVLATLDTSDLQAALRGMESRIKEAEAVLAEQEAGPRKQSIKAAEAVLQERQAAYELAQLSLAREENLQKSRASSQQAFDESRKGMERAQAAFEAAKEQLDELVAGTRTEQIDAQKARIERLLAQRDDLLVQLRDCQLIAPFSGIVSRRFVDEGIIANPDRPVLKVLQMDPLEARFGVSADDAAKLQPGSIVNLAKGTLVFPALVSRIEPELDQTTRTQGVIVSIATSQLVDDPAFRSALVPGQTVSLSLDETTANPDEFWVPIQALSRSIRGLWSVMSVASIQEEWIVARHDVQVVEVDGDVARIRSTTLRSGDPIIAEGLHRVTPGMAVSQ